MSNNIKGITVEIGGDTGPLSSALKGVNKTAGGLQSELREINKQLKFDPSSTVLLQQKQTLLAKEISTTKEKLTTLKDAEKQAEQQFNNGEIGEDKFRALQREVEKTESQLKSLEKQAREVGSVLGTQLENVGSKISSAGDKISGAGQKMLPATGAIVGIGVAAAKAGSDFEKSASKVSTIADTSVVSIDKLKEGVLKLSDETGESADDLNEALYQTISAGVKTGDALEFLGTAAKLAKGGFTDSTTAIDALTTTINAYGLKASDAKMISDQLIQTQNLGKTTVAELGGAIGNVIPIAASMNVSTKDLFSSLAELTKNGVKTDEAVTGMKSALSSILKPSTEAAKAAKQMGIDFSEAHLKNVGFPAFLKEIEEKTGGNSTKMAALFKNVRALNAVTILTGKGSKDFTNILHQMGNTAGTTDSAFEKMENNGASKWEKSMTAMKNAGIKLGEALAPIMDKISALIKSLSDKLAGLSKDQLNMLVNVALVTAAVAPVLAIGGRIIKAIGSFTVGIGSVIKGITRFHTTLKEGQGIFMALKTALGPGGIAMLIIAAIALIVIGIKHLWDTNEGFRTAVTNIWNGIKTVISTVANAIVDIFTVTIPQAWNSLVSFFSGIPAWWSNLWTSVGQLFTDFWNGIVSFFTQSIPAFIASAGQCFQQLPYNIGLALGTAVRDIINFGTSAQQWVTTQLPQIINGIVQWFQQLPGRIWTALTQVIAKIGQWITGMGTQVATGVPSLINRIGTWFSQLPGKIWNALLAALQNVQKWCANLISTAGTEIPKFVESVVGFMQQLPGKMLDIGKNIVYGIWNGITGATKWLWDHITGWCNDLVDGFKKGLGIHSPSKLFADVIGKNLALGIGQGFSDNISAVVQSMMAAIPVIPDSGPQVRAAMAAVYGGYSVSASGVGRTDRSGGPKVSGGVVINQHNEINSPKALSPAEISRNRRNENRQLVLALKKV